MTHHFVAISEPPEFLAIDSVQLNSQSHYLSLSLAFESCLENVLPAPPASLQMLFEATLALFCALIVLCPTCFSILQVALLAHLQQAQWMRYDHCNRC